MYLPPELNDWGNLFWKIAEFFILLVSRQNSAVVGAARLAFLPEASGVSDLDPEMAQLCYKP